MNYYIEKDYISRAGLHLEKFSWLNADLAVCRCPFCGDSKRNSSERRHYFIRRKTGWQTFCHNCNSSFLFGNFLKVKFPFLYDEFIFEKYKNVRVLSEPKLEIPDCRPIFRATKNEFYSTINELGDEHPAKQYILNRKIPEEFHSKLWFTSRFNDLVHELGCPEEKKYPNDSRIVIPALTKSGAVLHVSGRSMIAGPKRYYTVNLSDFPAIFGLWRLKKGKRIYVTEGQFDSMFLPNCLSCAGSSMNKLNDIIAPAQRRNVTIVFDCEPRNKQIVQGMIKSINHGYSVCVWNRLIDKDINQEIQNGKSAEQIKSLIDESTFFGLSGLIKIGDWRRC